MNTTAKHLFAAAVVAMTLTGCTNGDNEPDITERKECPEFSAIIGDSDTRAYNQMWETNDEIGISGAGRTNVRHVTSANDGTFTVKTEGEQIYFQNEKEVTFTAYYPWKELTGESARISADTKDQKVETQKGFDFLWAQGTGKKTAPLVKFNFAHKMAKVSLLVKTGKGLTYDELKAATLSLGGFRHTGSFNPADGVARADAAAATDKWVFSGGVAAATYNDADKTAAYSLIFFPQVLDKPLTFMAELALAGDNTYRLTADIDFTNANKQNDGDKARNEWVAARQYTLSLTLHKTDITLDPCVINSWTEVSGGNIDVD